MIESRQSMLEAQRDAMLEREYHAHDARVSMVERQVRDAVLDAMIMAMSELDKDASIVLTKELYQGNKQQAAFYAFKKYMPSLMLESFEESIEFEIDNIIER